MWVLQLSWLCEIMGGMLLMCQNTTMWVYGARIKRCCVLCSKHIAVWVYESCHNFPLVRDKPPGGARICETGLLGSQRLVLETMFQHYLEQHPHDFSFLVDQVWIYNLWFTTKFLGQIWWKKDLWIMFSNAKSMTCNLEMKSISAMQNPFNW